MKYIGSSDWHIRSTRPQFRTDNTPIVVLKKVNFLVKIANRYNARLLCSGDIFHSSKIRYSHYNKLVDILNKCRNGVYCVPGQHDMEHHKLDLIDSPYYSLVQSKIIYDVSKKPRDNVFGIAFGGELNIGNYKINKESILLVHDTVTEKEPPFFLDKARSSQKVMRDYPLFSWIVCGDYHVPHTRRTISKRVLINCGSITRSNKDQINHVPYCYFFDTEKPGAFKKIKIPIKNSDEVFTIPAQTEEDYDFSGEIKELVLLIGNKENTPKFHVTVKFIMKKANANKNQIKIADRFLGEIKENE